MKHRHGLLRRIWMFVLIAVLLVLQLPTSAFAAGSSATSAADEHPGQVHVIVENTTFTKDNAASLDAEWKDTYWSGTLVDTWVGLSDDSTMMSLVVSALDGYEVVGASDNYISSINHLAQMDGGSQSGWTGTLNDWFVNKGFASFGTVSSTSSAIDSKDKIIQAGDEIRVMYTVQGGVDLGGDYYNNDKTVSNVTFSAGTLDQAFSSAVKSYTLTLPAGTDSVLVTPTATNKNFQVRTSVEGTEYSRSQAVPVQDGTVITVTCGDPSWPTMNNAADVPAETYTFTVSIPKTWTVTLPEGTGYTVSPASGSVSPVTDGGSYQFTVALADGYQAGPDFAVSANGTALTEADGVYTISNITENQTITVTGVTVKPKTATFVTDPSDALVQVYDADGNTVQAGDDGAYAGDFSNTTYTYTVTKYGYVAQKGEIPADGGEIKVTLEAAKDDGLSDVSAYWPNFRGSDDNMAIRNVETPTSSTDAELKWSKKLGSGWSAMPSVQIIADNSLIVMSGKTLYKLSLDTGEVLASGTMAAAPNWGYTPPTYAEGMIFCPLESGRIQAFDATTLKSLWIYQDPLKGQALSPITYSDGYIYTGFWKAEDQPTHFVCLSVTDEDPDSTDEAKTASWMYEKTGGFYWAGSVVVGDAVIVGSDDGALGYQGTGEVYSFNKRTGALISSLDVTGDQRSSIAYDAASGKIYFTTKAGYLCSASVNASTGELSGLKSVGYDAQSTSTPVVYKNRVYFATSGSSSSGSAGNLVVADADTLEKIYSEDMKGYPQCSLLLSTAYEASEGYLYLYATYNTMPGGLTVMKTTADAKSADDAEISELYDAAGFEQYCISSPICGPDGTIYYKNDSGNVLAVGLNAAAKEKHSVSIQMSSETPTAKLYAASDAEKSTDLLAGVKASSNVYTTKLAAGDYILEGYNSSGEYNGSIQITVASEGNSSFKIWTAYNAYASNGGWVRDTDYTVTGTVTAADGTQRTVESGLYTNWGRTCPSWLCLDGDTIKVDYTPTEKQVANGYIPTSVSVKMTQSHFVEFYLEIPHSKLVTIHAPKGSVITAGLFYNYYKYDFGTIVSTTEDENGVTTQLRVKEGRGSYFCRVQNPDGVTWWNFYSSLDDDITVTADDLHLNDSSFTSSTVYPSFEQNVYDLGNIYMNINPQEYLSMSSGETYPLNMFRNWQAINSFMNSQIALPDFHYQVVDINGNPSDVVSITPDENNSAWGTLKAEKAGTAIVLVTYDAMTDVTGQGGTQYSAIWPEFTGVFLVSVDQGTPDIQTNITMDRMNGTSTEMDTELDTLFYTGDEGAEYSFKPEDGCSVEIARSSIKDGKLGFNGFTTSGVTKQDDGTFVLTGLTTGRHIVKVTKDGQTTYQVITARKVSYTVTDKDGNVLGEDDEIKPGEEVTIQFTGLTNPIEKMAGAYNFHASLYYLADDGKTSFASSPGGFFGVYDFSGNPERQKFTVKIPDDWTEKSMTLTGAIQIAGFANVAFGGHRSFAYVNGFDFNPSSPTRNGKLGRLPELTLKVDQPASITYDGNGSEEGTVPTDDGTYYNTDSISVADNTGNLARTGYTFLKWNTERDGSGTDYMPGDTINIKENTTLYAQWKPNTYKVRWTDDQGNILYESTSDYGTMPEYKGPEPTKEATAEYTYTFIGWQAQPWDGEDSSTPKAKTHAALMSLTDDASSADTDSAPASTSEGLQVTTGHVIYKAVFRADKRSYTITWKNNDGSVLETSSVLYGDVPAYPGQTSPEAAGQEAGYNYYFSRWTPEITAVTGDAAYTAEYTREIQTYTVKWLDADGTVLETQENVPYGTTVTYDGKNPVKEQDAQYIYTFTGWTSDNSGNVGEEPVTITADTEIRPVFSQKLREYQIRWLDEDGTVLLSESVPYGELPAYSGTLPQKKDKSGKTYVLKGWTPEVTAVTKDADYTAVYETEEFTLTLDANGGKTEVASVTTTDNGKVSGLPDLTRDGYTFSGWFTDKTSGKQVKNGDVVTSDGTLYAHWAAKAAPAAGNGKNASGTGTATGTTTGTAAAATSAPATGDNTNIILWVVLLAAAAALAGLFARSRRKGHSGK